ncbi:hypothetical protein ACFQY9_10505 [Microvirga aerilata]|uniref:hypothetical protein n=1 Tax=Microvirga aerilata TaxID=670292 RepID=UPI0036262F74
MPPFDAIRDLVIRVPTRICRRYFGLPISEDREDEFARWTMDISSYLFGDPLGDPAVREKARQVAEHMRAFLDRAIGDARAESPDETTILGRLVAMQRQEGGPTDAGIRAHLMGMITGFVPTDTVAAGHMLDVLIGNGRFLTWRRTRFTKPVMRAIEANDDRQLTKCLFETLRFLPINPGPFRVCSRTYEVEGEGGSAGDLASSPKRLASSQARNRPCSTAAPSRGRTVSIHPGAVRSTCSSDRVFMPASAFTWRRPRSRKR